MVDRVVNHGGRGFGVVVVLVNVSVLQNPEAPSGHTVDTPIRNP